MAINYVRFQRGSQAAYNKLISANRIDDNTLYFIYTDENATIGSLYLGDKLIGGNNIDFTNLKLSDLADVIATGAETNSFLVRNEEGNWIARSVNEVAALIQANFKDTAIFQVILQKDETDENAIDRIVGDSLLTSGDIVIVKNLIIEDKYEYTAYVYTGEAWAAMDGNYNATNVYFDTDLTITADIGVQEIDDSGFKILDTNGKNLKQVLDMIMVTRKIPNKVDPSVSVSFEQNNSYEVGSTVSISYEATLDPGSYTYGPNTDIIATKWNVIFNGESQDSNSGTFTSFIVTDDTNLKISATATHGSGAIPKDNLGNNIVDSTELLQCQIQSGEKTGYSSTITGYRNVFMGSKITPIELTSDNIRNLVSSKASNNTIEVSIAEGTKQVILAVPSNRKVIEVADKNAFGINIFSKFILSTINVGGADATKDNIGNNVDVYNVYVYSPLTALSANTYTVTLANK